MTSSSPMTNRPDRTLVLAILSRSTWLVPLHAALLVAGTWEHQPDPETQLGRWSRYVSTDRFLVNHLVVSELPGLRVARDGAAVTFSAPLALRTLGVAS